MEQKSEIEIVPFVSVHVIGTVSYRQLRIELNYSFDICTTLYTSRAHTISGATQKPKSLYGSTT